MRRSILALLIAAMIAINLLPESRAEDSQAVRLTLHPRGAEAGLQWPVTFGVPFPRGEITAEPAFWLESPDGTPCHLQQRVTARWPDGSVRWMLFDAIVTLGSSPENFLLQWNGGQKSADIDASFVKDEETVAVILPPTMAVFDRQRPVGLLYLESQDAEGHWHPIFPDGMTCDFVIEDQEGVSYSAFLSLDNHFEIEEDGPVRALVKSEGWLTSETGRQLGRVIQRVELFSGLPFIRVYHTFIKTADSEEVSYRNIRMEWPFIGDSFAFYNAPGFTGDAGIGGYLIQYRHDAYEIVVDEAVLTSGKHATGRVTVGEGQSRYSIVVQDFRETFPNEIEVQEGLLNLHFWPRHSRPAPYIGEAMTEATVGHLGWVHGGELLDFSIPPEFYRFSYGGRDDGIINAADANAMGIARTVEYGVFLHGQQTAGAQMDAFLRRPRMIADPAWLAKSGDFWQIAGRDEHFSEVEDALEKTLEFLPAMYERIGDYGKWNYGAFHQSYLPTLDRAHLHRIWKGIHHGAPRWPWLQAVRSGKPEHYDWAITNANHNLDIAVVNWEDPDYNAKYMTNSHVSGNFKLKYLGGLNRYKGTVHWYAGQRMFYNAIVDFALWYYYLTGYQRAWDVAMNMGEFLIHAGGDPKEPNYNPYDVRLGTGRGAMAVSMYRATGDERYARIARNQMEHFMKRHAEDPDNAYRQFYYAPFFERYLEVFEDKHAEAVVVEWARQRMAENQAWDGRDPYYNLMALAYRISGDPAFLEYALVQARLLLANRGTGADPVLEGVLIDNYPGNPGYTAQQWGDLVRAVRLHEQKTGELLSLPSVIDLPPMRTEFRALRTATDAEGKPKRELVFVVRKDVDKELSLGIPLQSSDELLVTVLNPDGETSQQRLNSSDTEKHFEINLPSNAVPGDYRITIAAQGSNPRDLSSVWPFHGNFEKLVVQMPFDLRNSGRFYFQPRPGTLGGGVFRLRTSIRPRYYRTHAVYRPDGSEAFRKTEQGHVNGNWNTPIRFTIEEADGLWLYTSSGLINSDGAWIDGHVMPYAAFTPSQFFIPAKPTP